ncbi:hypothetical protein Bbelb_311150 [Branchiostoma belcheri]|nr:hypothetical protein Bbelb_311150 [Branchiostoma belcheri]
MSAILFATRSLPNALNKEIVGDLSHIARCRSALGAGSVEIGGCDVMREIDSPSTKCWGKPNPQTYCLTLLPGRPVALGGEAIRAPEGTTCLNTPIPPIT